MNKTTLALMAGLASLTALASHVEQTVRLSSGWNAIYLEVTPDDGDDATTGDAACETVFGDGEFSAVTTVMAYQSNAYEATSQYASDGSEILQQPVSYLTWMRGDESSSTLRSLVGGRCYLVFVDAARLPAGKSKLEKTIVGIPSAPTMTWRDTTDGDFVNLAGVTLSTSDKVTAAKYFGEGPYGAGTLYKVSGTNSVPTFKSITFLSPPKVESGLAYGASAERSGDWGGVIGFVGSDKVVFGSDDLRASVEVKNAGTTNHTFRFSIAASSLAGESLPPEFKRKLSRTDAIVDSGWTNLTAASVWEETLAPGASVVETFSINRLQMSEGACGAVLVVDDVSDSGSQMRVRVPVLVASNSVDAATFPVGLWSGFIQMEAVSRLDDTNMVPVKAGGTLRMNVMMHVAPDGAVKLLQRVASGVDSNGTVRLWKELESVPFTVENARRFSTVMMSIDNPVVDKTSGQFGDSLAFDWTVAERASDNPFRHAWHPDHDGKTADYSGPTPSGDDLSNYANLVKPELWSITNRMEFSWHEGNDPSKPVDFERTPTEKTAGFVTWTVSGLTAKEPIVSFGVFVLRRMIKAAEIEE